MIKDKLLDAWNCKYCRNNALFLILGGAFFIGGFKLLSLPFIFLAGINAGKKLRTNEITKPEVTNYGPDAHDHVFERYGASSKKQAVQQILTGKNDNLPGEWVDSYEMFDPTTHHRNSTLQINPEYL